MFLGIVWSLDFLGIRVRYTTDSVTSKISSLWLLSGFETCTNLLCSMQSPVVQFLCLLCQVKKKNGLEITEQSKQEGSFYSE